jgi:hypothetical protein
MATVVELLTPKNFTPGKIITPGLFCVLIRLIVKNKGIFMLSVKKM